MFTKYADCEVVSFEVSSPAEIRKTSSFEHIPEDRFKTKDGYIYVKVRAISSRVNKNHDGWPVNELAGMKESAFRDLQKELDEQDDNPSKEAATKLSRVFTSKSKKSSDDYGYKTFIGRPIFIDHNNSDPRRARGIVVDSVLHIEPTGKRYSASDYWSKAPDNHKPETHIELLLEVDGKSFPKLARALKDGRVGDVSMGANVTHTICSICEKTAKTVDDYCSHIKRKGINYTRADGRKTSAYEDCYNPNFFEISFVFDPADTTARPTGPIITAGVTPPRPEGECPDCNGDGRTEMGNCHCPKGRALQHETNETDKAEWAVKQAHEDEYHEVAPAGDDDDPDKLMSTHPSSTLDHSANEDNPHSAFIPDAGTTYSEGKQSGFTYSAFLKEAPHKKESATAPGVNLTKTAGFRDKLAGDEPNLTHNKYDTLREEAHCPFDIRHCGMDEKSGHCDVCGFSAPPAGMGAPDIQKAQENLHRIEDKKKELGENNEEGLNFRLEESGDVPETKDIESLVKEIANIRNHHSKTLTNKQSREINLQTNHEKSGVMNKRSQIVFTAAVETIPTDTQLLQDGWDVVAATPKTPIAEDGQKATNEPQTTRVVNDQLAPVTSSLSKESTLDSTYPTPNTGAEGGNGADGTPQFHGPGGKINEEGGLNEHHPSKTLGTGSNHPVPDTSGTGGHVSDPQYNGGMQNSKSDPPSTGLTEHHPTAVVPASYTVPGTGPDGGGGNVAAPQFTSEETGGKNYEADGITEHHPDGGTKPDDVPQTPKDKGKFQVKSSEAHLIDTLKLARLEIDLGLLDSEHEYNRVAQLEKVANNDVLIRYQALSNVKQAGLSKTAASTKSSMTLPSMKHVEASETPAESTIAPDEAIFGH